MESHESWFRHTFIHVRRRRIQSKQVSTLALFIVPRSNGKRRPGQGRLPLVGAPRPGKNSQNVQDSSSFTESDAIRMPRSFSRRQAPALSGPAFVKIAASISMVRSGSSISVSTLPAVACRLADEAHQAKGWRQGWTWAGAVGRRLLARLSKGSSHHRTSGAMDVEVDVCLPHLVESAPAGSSGWQNES